MLQGAQEYEDCQELVELIKCIEDRDVGTYIELHFDVKELTKVGMLKKGWSSEQIEKRICSYFGLDTIFDYSNIGYGCICYYKKLADSILNPTLFPS